MSDWLAACLAPRRAAVTGQMGSRSDFRGLKPKIMNTIQQALHAKEPKLTSQFTTCNTFRVPNVRFEKMRAVVWWFGEMT